MDINYHIRDILLSRDGLVIPKVGSIRVQYLPAEIDRKNNKILPPRRKYTFDPSIKEDHDKILVKKLATIYKISQTEASKKVAEFADDLWIKLNKDKQYNLEGIGKIYKDEKGNLNFEEEHKTDKNLGMEALEAEPFELVKPEKKQPTEKPVASFKKKKRRSPLFITGMATLALIVVLFVVAGIYTGFFTYYYNKYTGNLKKENTEITQAPKKEQSKAKQDTAVKEEKFDSAIDQMTDKKTALMYKDKKNTKQYHLIAGSFKRRTNAEVFQKELKEKGYSSEILENDGLFRISVRSFKSKEEALVSLYHMRDTTPFKSVWLLTLNQKDQ